MGEETYADRYPVRTQIMTNQGLIEEADRLETTYQLDRFDQLRLNFVKAELTQRRAYQEV